VVVATAHDFAQAMIESGCLTEDVDGMVSFSWPPPYPTSDLHTQNPSTCTTPGVGGHIQQTPPPPFVGFRVEGSSLVLGLQAAG
jgi:hypothetical protein